MPRKSNRNPEFDRTVGQFIGNLRNQNGWSLLSLNKEANLRLTKSALSGIEHGAQQLTVYQLFLLSKALKFSIDDLFDTPTLKKFLPGQKIKILFGKKEITIDEI